VFARRRLLAEPSPFDSSQPCFSSRPSADREVAALRDTGNPGFPGGARTAKSFALPNTRKRRLARSTQFSRNRIPGPTRGRRRSSGVHAPKRPPKRRTVSIAKSSLSVNDFVGRA